MMDEWKTIETAPRDRTAVLVYWNSMVVGEARYDPDEGHEGWWWANLDWSDNHAERMSPEPTHWMPLPPPPAKEPQ
jgi:hypothetical protein